MEPSSASQFTVISPSAMARALMPSDDSLDYDNTTGKTPWTQLTRNARKQQEEGDRK